MVGFAAVIFADSVSTKTPVRAVKNGFIHFHNPAAAHKQPNAMVRSKSLPALRDNTVAGYFSDDSDIDCFDLPARSAASPAAKALVEPAFEIRTPSTRCSSPFSAMRPSPPTPHEAPRAPRTAEVAAECGARDAVVRTPRSAPARLPFASLGLPQWAIEKALATPRPTDFGELQSWYSEPPRSTPAFSPAASPRSSPHGLLGVRADGEFAPAGWGWADTTDDEYDTSCQDQEETESLAKSTVSLAAGSQPEDLHGDDPSPAAASPPEQSCSRWPPCPRVAQWADLADDEEEQSDNEETRAETASLPAARSPASPLQVVFFRRVKWADLSEDMP